MRFIYLFLACGLCFTACTNTTNKTAATTDSASATTTAATATLPPTSAFNDAGTQKLNTVVTKYYNVKNAFVAINAGNAVSAAAELATATDSLKGFLKGDNAHAAVMPYADTVWMTASTIAKAPQQNGTIDQQKETFSKMSDALFALLQKVQYKNANVYQQHCPMALNDKGANWLSNESEIKNPYYGKKMLECGDIADSLK